jgi:DNA polymerase-3 subunit alpha
MREREKNGAYQSLEDFINRAHITGEQLILAIRAGAFRFTGKPKAHLLWEAHFLSSGKKESSGPELFQKPTARNHTLPDMPISDSTELSNQLEIFGFPTEDPFHLTGILPPERVRAADFPKYAGKVLTAVGYLITVKPTRTIKGERMYFGTFTDEEGQWMDTVHFPEPARMHPFRGSGVYILKGKITDDFGVPSLEVHYMKKRHYEGVR